MALTKDEVDFAFRMILGRPPESDAAMEFHLHKFPDVAALRNHLFNTVEFRQSYWHRLAEGDASYAGREMHFAREKLVFLHIPKNAGTSLNRILETLCPETEIFPHQSLISHYPAFFIARHFLFRGHYTLHEIQYIPGPKCIFTLLREPRARILSQYHYHKSSKIGETAINDLPMVHKARLPLREYLLDEEVRRHISVDNMQTRYLFYLSAAAAGRFGVVADDATSPFDRLPRRAVLEIAKENLAGLDYVGTVEGFDQFLTLFCEERGIPVPTDIRRQNVTRELGEVDPKAHSKVSFEHPDEEIHHLLDDLVDLDEELYRFGAGLFKQRYNEHRGLHAQSKGLSLPALMQTAPVEVRRAQAEPSTRPLAPMRKAAAKGLAAKPAAAPGHDKIAAKPNRNKPGSKKTITAKAEQPSRRSTAPAGRASGGSQKSMVEQRR